MQIQELISTLGITGPLKNNFKVRGVTCNSKAVAPGFVFVAMKGTHVDGATFINEAIKRGTRAIVEEKRRKAGVNVNGGILFISVHDARKALGVLAASFYDNPSAKIKVVGVTGTNGKTTITYLLEAILKAAGSHPAVIGTINYRYNNNTSVSTHTTPGAVELQSMLSSMVRAGVRYAIMEVSSHALDQDRTEGVQFRSAIFTNLTQDHLDYHKTLNRYFKAKRKLFTQLPPGAFAVVNNDDPYSAKLKKFIKVKTLTYGILKRADVMAKDIRTDCDMTRFTLLYKGRKCSMSCRLIGRYNVYNILAATAWAIEEGVALAKVISSVKKFNLVPGRLEKIKNAANVSVFVDYAHTEDALKNVLSTLRGVAKKRIIVVFGCGGERDKTKRPKMGKVATELSDYAVITNDNPRSEEPLEIIKDIQRGICKNNYCIVPERLEAIKKSLSLARSGDIVLIAGKGHEKYQILKNRTLHFDDREAVKECLESMNS